jgi:Carboxypeptidase regulatory-like domain
MIRAVAIFALGASACALREPRAAATSGAPCSNNNQCDSSVCFLGECRDPATSLSLVHAEVRTSDSTYGTLQTGAIDLTKTPVADFTLQPLLNVSGRVMQKSDAQGTSQVPVPGAAVVFTDLNPGIPDRIVSISAQSDTSAATQGSYTVRLPASVYDVLVAAANQPAVHPDGPVLQSNPSLDLVLPATAQLAHVHGVLVTGGTPLAGAQVSAVDAAGFAIAVPQVSGTDGSFTLDLPPGPPPFSLQVGAPTAPGPSTSDPLPAFAPKTFPANQAADLKTIELGVLPPPATFNGRVVDARGAPVASARVLLLSTANPGAAPLPYVLSRQATTAADGSFSVPVREGTYLVEVAPDVDPQQPAISDPLTLAIVAPATDLASPIRCPDKIKVTGTVLRPDGKTAPAGLRIDATRVGDPLVASRGTQSTTTDAAGAFSFFLDRGRHRVEIVPGAESGLPRTILVVDVPASPAPVALPPLRIAPPHELVGTVRAPGNPARSLPGATIDFYALDSTGKRSVLIGNAIADSAGAYTAVLPDVPQPAGQ